MRNTDNNQEEKDKFFARLRSLTLKDLVLLYIEANTGTEKDIDMLPMELLDRAEKLTNEFRNTLREKQTDKLLDDLFKETE